MRIYVSATFRDLRECRAVVHTTLRQLRQDDIAMEHYVAEPQRPLDVCLRDVRECDLYLGIFAWRYGHVPDDHDTSITESEYRAARAAGIPCLVFLLHEDAPWPRSMVDRDADRIEALRDELQKAHTVTFFSAADELGRVVATAVNRRLIAATDPASHLPQLDEAALNRYFERLRAEYGRLDLHGLTPPRDDDDPWIRLESVFVEPDVREDRPPVEVPPHLMQRLYAQEQIDEDELPEGFDLADLRAAQEAYRAKPRRPVLGVVAGAERRLVILGNPGAGKSTLARYLALALTGLSEAVPHLAGHLPLLVELKLYLAAREKGDCRSVSAYLHHLAESQGLAVDRARLEPYLDGGGAALIVFDGLDEVFDPARRDEVTREIAEFASRHPSARVVVTSRIHGYRFGTLTGAGFTHHTLQDLDADQIERFLSAWYALVLPDRPADAATRQARLMSAVHASSSIGELAGNPLLLTILAIIGKHQELPRERFRVYDHAASVLVRHWDAVRNLSGGQRGLTEKIHEDDKRELLRRLAWRMQNPDEGEAGNFVHRSDLQSAFESYLVERYQMPRLDAADTARAMIDQFERRDFVLSRYGPDLYGFVHRGLLEFFCADEVLKRFQHEQTLSVDGLVALFTARCADPSWTEVLRLIASEIAEPHVEAVITALLEVDRPWSPGRFEKPPRGLALAVQCLAEVGNLRGVADAAERVLADLVLLLEHGVGIADYPSTSMITAEVLPAAQTVGAAWPGRALYERWYRRRGRRLVWAPTTELAARLLVVLFLDRADVLLDLADLHEEPRSTSALKDATGDLAAVDLPTLTGVERRAVDPAALGAHRPRVLELTRSGRAGLRALGLALLERFAPDDPDLEPLLRDRLAHDDDGDVVRIAAGALLRRHPDDRTILDTVADRTEHNLDNRFGGYGVDLLLRHRPTDPRTAYLRGILSWTEPNYDANSLLTDPDAIATAVGAFTAQPTPDRAILIELVTSSVDYRVRHNALVLLDHLAPDGPDLEPLLRDRLAHDEDEDVFHTAAEALLRRHPGDPTALDVVIDRTGHNLDNPIGLRGVDLLLRHRPTDPRIPLFQAVSDGAVIRWLLTDAADITAAAVPLAAHGAAARTALTALAAHSPDPYARHNALVLLDRLVPEDPDLEALLRDRLAHDDEGNVVRFAAEALLRRRPDDPTTLDTVADRTEDNLDSNLGHEGAALLLRHRPTDPRTAVLHEVARWAEADSLLLPEQTGAAAASLATHSTAARTALTALVVRSPNYRVRHNSLVLLDRLAPDDPAVETLLRDCLADDEDDDVFHTAAEALLRRHPHDPAVLDTVLARTEDDGNPLVRRRGVDLLTRHRPDDLRTAALSGLAVLLDTGGDDATTVRGLIGEQRVSPDDLPELHGPYPFSYGLL